MKPRFLDKLLEKIEHLQPNALSNYLQELMHEKGVLETLFNALLEGIIVLDREEHLLYLNSSAEKFFGLKAIDALGKKLSELLPEIPFTYDAETREMIGRDMELFYPEHRFLDAYSVPLFSNNQERRTQELAGHAIILRDSTDSRQKQASHLASERSSLATLMAASVAHEIGNPLNSLTIHLHLIERKLHQLKNSQNDSLLSSLSIAKGEVERLDQIITQFLSAIRPTPLILQKDHLNDIIKESLSFLQEEIKNRNITLSLHLAPNLPARSFDRNQIKQALYNILRNSFQAMQQGGKLEVITEYDDSYLWVSVGDTGGGISQENFEKIFQPYFSTKGENNLGSEGGSGLGLYVIERIVRAHHGEILLENQRDASTGKKGILFTLRFLRDDAQIRTLPSAERSYLMPAQT